MYAGTKFNWFDQSEIYSQESITQYESSNRDLYLVLTTADKGPEKLNRVYGDEFYRYYGRNLSFDKHGQALLQARKIINAGGELLIKRFVAKDATLSNIIIVAKVKEGTKNKVNNNGKSLYVDGATGNETTKSSYVDSDGSKKENKHVTCNCASITFELKYLEGAKTFNDVYNHAASLYKKYDATTKTEGVYPLIVCSDIGRGSDRKRLRIYPDYDTSRSVSFMIYTFFQYENTVYEERTPITMENDVFYKGSSYAINGYNMEQLHIDIVPGVYEQYAKDIASISGESYETVLGYDLIYGCNRKGIALNCINIESGADIGYEFGVELLGGTDGEAYNDKNGNYIPKTSNTLTGDMVNWLQGSEDEAELESELFDKELHKICAIFDANYPLEVKEALASFVNFREDCVFFRDYGTGLSTLESIEDYNDKLTKSKFVADYMTSYQVIDPFTKRRIDVTCIYGLIPCVLSHFKSGVAKPLAGEVNNFVVSEALPNTINYTPRETPSINQKTALDDRRINYAIPHEWNGELVFDSLYTSQAEYTQLSFLNNVLAIQEVMRAIRRGAPKNRFKFLTGNDFSEYQTAVNTILAEFRANFNSLEMIYQQDELKALQKIYYAVIEFSFNNWVQSEIFDLYAISTTSISIADNESNSELSD